MLARLAFVAAMLAALLVPGSALAADPVPDQAPVFGPPVATPVVSLTGGGIAPGSGPAWFVPTATAGQASLEIAAGDADQPAGYQVDAFPAGWSWSFGESLGAGVILNINWDAGAPDALVTIEAWDVDGNVSAPAYLQLVSVAAPMLVGDVAWGSPEVPAGSAPTLSWREGDGRGQGIAGRIVSGEHAAPVAGGCPTEGWAPDADTIALDALSLFSFAPSAVPVAQEVPDPAITAQLPLRGLSAGCHRFRVEIVDTLGQTAAAVSPALLVEPAGAASLTPTPWGGVLDLFRPSAFVTQATSTWCVAAAALMMTNLVLGRADRSAVIQSSFITLAQKYDGLSSTVGTNAVGWAAVLSRRSGVRYEALFLDSFADALQVAAARMSRTGKPVGIIVNGGTHAWVLHGVVAQTDPSREPTTVSAVFVSGPLYSPGGGSYDPPPDVRLSVRDLQRVWRPLGPGYDNAGTWVVVAPVQ
jgi:hypothetical protein